MTGLLVDIKRFAIHDGPGIRTTLFMKGCSLSCRWCHNPESISKKTEIGFLGKKCTGCGKCVEICPNNAHALKEGIHTLDRSKCIACGKCVDACLPGALENYGREITVEEAVDKVIEDKVFYSNSNGGCTISGGEPLLQAEFCKEVFKRLQKKGVHCAIDTSGATPWSNFETALPYVDMFLYDVKHTDAQQSQKHTGLSCNLVLSNLERLSQCGVPIEIRIPAIPEFNFDEASFDAIGKFLSKLKNIIGVRLLPYHNLARSKYEALGKPDTMPHVPAPTSEQMRFAASVLKNFDLKVK